MIETMPERRFTRLPAPLGDTLFGMDRPLVASDEELLRRNIMASIEDEASAGSEYDEIARKARELGRKDIASAFEAAARDEVRHNREFKELLFDLELSMEQDRLAREFDNPGWSREEDY